MKPFALFLLTFAALQSHGQINQSKSQTKETPKPVFFSVVTLDEPVGDYHLISNYYPLKDNIDNKASAVYVSDTPTLNQIQNAAINLPSDFYIIFKNNVALNKVMLI